jgi:ABC-type branched-subunit amino acid transport system permease subunit
VLNQRVSWLPFGLSRYTGRQVLFGGLIVLALLLLPILDSNSSHVSAVADAGYILLLAFGLNIIVGYTGLLALGFAAFFAIGAYTYAFVASPQLASPAHPDGYHVSFWLMLLVSAAVAAAFGVILGAPTLRLRGDYLAIVTLGFGEIVPQLFQNLDKWTGGPDGIAAVDQPVLFHYHFGFNPTPYYYLYMAVICICLVLLANLRNSRLGRAWMAIREDELAAEHMGINTMTAKLLAFSMGAAFAGVAGVIYAAKLSTISPSGFDFNMSIMILAAIVLGGMGNLSGVLLGGSIVAMLNFLILPQASNWAHAIGASINSSFLMNVDLTQYRFMLYGIILVLVMLFRPEGLIPSATVRAELRESMKSPEVA